MEESGAGVRRRDERGLVVITICSTLVDDHMLLRFLKGTRGREAARDSDSNPLMSSDLQSALSWVRVASWLCNRKREKQ